MFDVLQHSAVRMLVVHNLPPRIKLTFRQLGRAIGGTKLAQDQSVRDAPPQRKLAKLMVSLL